MFYRYEHAGLCSDDVLCFTGVNMPDHAVMFSNLLTLLQDQVTPHIAVLHAKDCPNVKSIMNKMVTQLLENADLVSLHNEYRRFFLEIHMYFLGIMN